MEPSSAERSPGPALSLTIYATPQDLPAGLRRYAAPVPGTELVNFHHPLFVTLFPVASPLPIEEFIGFRQDRADAFLDKGDLANYVFAHERAYRMRTLQYLADDGYFDEGWRHSIKFWRIASQVWVDAEHAEDNPCWSELMNSHLPNRWAMTKPADRRSLRDMPERITLYRGVQAFDEKGVFDAAGAGWSWTRSSVTANFFARRFLPKGMKPFVVAADVPKTAVEAYLTGRNEQEMLVRPGTIAPSDLILFTD